MESCRFSASQDECISRRCLCLPSLFVQIQLVGCVLCLTKRPMCSMILLLPPATPPRCGGIPEIQYPYKARRWPTASETHLIIHLVRNGGSVVYNQYQRCLAKGQAACRYQCAECLLSPIRRWFRLNIHIFYQLPLLLLPFFGCCTLPISLTVTVCPRFFSFVVLISNNQPTRPR